jgi:hypothetical protein
MALLLPVSMVPFFGMSFTIIFAFHLYDEQAQSETVSLANLYCAQGRYGEAEPLFQKLSAESCAGSTSRSVNCKASRA